MPGDQATRAEDLIAGLSDWNNGGGISAEASVACMGSIELAIGYSRLFWPEFVEHEGGIFFSGFSMESYQGFMEQCKGDLRSVEAVMNHRHLRDFFGYDEGRMTDKQLTYIGRVLKETWRSKLERDFPHTKMIVSFDEGPFDDLTEYQITFWQATERDR